MRERDSMAEGSEYDQRLRDAILALGGEKLSPGTIAAKLRRSARGMDASLRAAAGRVDWFERRDGGWCLTKAGRESIEGAES